MKTICYVLAISLILNLVGCGKIRLLSGIEGFSVPEIKNVAFDNSSNRLSEVAPPKVIQKLDETLAQYEPQVTILSPSSKTTLQDTTVEVNLAVEGYPLFKDDRLEMGNHLHLILDNEPYGEIYNLDEPIVLADLKPGTHSLRVLAEKPWHESFKNQGAYAQISFNVLTETESNHPNTKLPLLTYNQPTGVYVTEPILLDFYLTNVKAQDWQIKATINGESFVMDEWQPAYLTGFKEGNNLIELELLDGEGKAIPNAFNKTIRLIDYSNQNSSLDTLAKLMKDRISFEEAIAIAEQNYYIQPVGELEEMETITEESSLEAPAEPEIEASEVEVEPETETELPIEAIEEITPEESEEIKAEIETKIKTEEIIEEPTAEIETTEKALTDKSEEIIKKAEETSTIDTEETPTTKTTPEELIELQKKETPAIPPQSFSKQKNVPTNSVIEKTTSSQLNRIETREEIKEMPFPEEIPAVETEEDVISSEIEESDSITIKIPKPKKLKVPQWWKDLVANLQQRFNLN